MIDRTVILSDPHGLPLFVEEAWPQLTETMGRPYTGVRGRLTCGHFGDICGDASSTWDFPHEVQVCPEGCGEVQFHLYLQAALEDS